MPYDDLILRRIREGEADAWTELIARFEGRLLAFVESRTGNRTAAEDIVQETFVGFLTSLPNYDGRRPLEGYLFSIAAHKLIDHLRREGRRPALPLIPAGSQTGGDDLCGSARPASSLARSSERRHLEEEAIAAAVADEIDHFRRRGQWEKLKCVELLFVRGWTNKETSANLGIPEKTVAGHKFEFLEKLRGAVRTQRLSEAVFPELCEKGLGAGGEGLGDEGRGTRD
jgi:RNA polymerase sigma-70 factor (ECF subfamily)